MTTQTTENHLKFSYALISRDVRRLTALIHQIGIGGEEKALIDGALEQIEARAWVALFYDPVSETLINDQDRYSDGRPVTTTIGWGDGFATLVHCPDPAHGTSGSGAMELCEELWPF